ncbi:hypothetical protein ACFLQP_00810, partial [Acidobacteriota bacterium]
LFHIKGDDPDLTLDINNGSNTQANYPELRFSVNNEMKARIYWSKYNEENKMYFENGGNTAITIDSLGKVGVNTTQIGANSAALTVCGKIECEEIEVKDIACDFVFEDHYNLDRLSDVEEYIKVNKHLPGVPPASVTKKGVNLGEFNQILLQKVEELTLYMIELKKENEVLKKRLMALEQAKLVE